MKKSSTLDLSRGLMSEPNLDAYLAQNQSDFSDEDMTGFLNRLYQRIAVSKATLARQAGMSEVYLHQVFSGRRRPSRDRLLCLCISWTPRWRRSSRYSREAPTLRSTPGTSGTPLSAMGFSMALLWKRSMRSWPRNRSSPCSDRVRTAGDANQTKIPLPVD